VRIHYKIKNMSRVRTFSRQFPSHHPRAGEATHFVEKVWASIGKPSQEIIDKFIWPDGWLDQPWGPKHHTIRAGHNFKVGDKFSPRVWSGAPYNSRQIIIAPDIEIKKIWDLEIDEADVWAMGLPGTQIKYLDDDQQARIAMNDGLTEQDLYWWFKGCKKPFVGQVICWNSNVEY